MPWQALHSQPPDLHGLKHFGEMVWVHDPSSSKLDPRAWEDHWLGFDVESHGHRVYNPTSHTIAVKCNVHFSAAKHLKGEGTDIPLSSETLNELDGVPTAPDAPANASTPPNLPDAAVELLAQPPLPPPSVLSAPLTSHPLCTCMPSQIVQELQSGVGMASTHCTDPIIPCGIVVLGSFSEDKVDDIVGGAWTVEDSLPALCEDWDSAKATFIAETTDSEALKPGSLAEAKCCLDWPLWEKAIEEELATLKAAETWRLEHSLPGANVIGSKWVFKAKKDALGHVMWYKACLVMQGFSQIGSVDYNDTYAPVAKLASSHLLIAMANCNYLELHQIDIKGV